MVEEGGSTKEKQSIQYTWTNIKWNKPNITGDTMIVQELNLRPSEKE